MVSILRLLASAGPTEKIQMYFTQRLLEAVQQLRLNSGLPAQNTNKPVEFCSLELKGQAIVFVMQVPGLNATLSPVPSFVVKRVVSAIRPMGEELQFNIVLFDGFTEDGASSSFSEAFASASPANINEALSFIRRNKKSSTFLISQEREKNELVACLSSICKNWPEGIVGNIVVIYVEDPPNKPLDGIDSITFHQDDINIHVFTPELRSWLQDFAIRVKGQVVQLKASSEPWNREVKIIPIEL